MSQSTLSEDTPVLNTDKSQAPDIPELNQTTESADKVFQRPVSQDLSQDNEFHYKPIPVLSPTSLLLGLASMVVFVTAFGIIIGVVGTILGTICVLGTLRNRQETGGFRMTVTGLALSALAATYGSSKLVYDYQTELPPGFERVSFSNDIAEKGLAYEKGKGSWTIHPEVAALNEKQIFLKGFMYPTRIKEGITEFILAKDNGECCFGGEPKVTDMILVKLEKPLEVDFTDKRVSVAGTFQTNRNQSEGLTQIYELKASHFSISKTAF